MAELIRSKPYPGTAQEFQAEMERLFNRCNGPWESSDSECLYFSEEWPKKEDKPATRVTWEVNTAERQPRGYAAIEVYEGASGTKVDFMDGYHPSPVRDREPIGPAFQEFAKWVIREVWPRETKPTPANELGPFYIPMTLRQFERNLEMFVEQEIWLSEDELLMQSLKPPGWWRSGADDIREADEIELLCNPFRGLVLELDQKEVDLLVVVIRPETYEEAIMEPPPDDAVEGHFEGFTAIPIGTVAVTGTITSKWTRPADLKAYAALSAWLESLSPPARPTSATLDYNPIRVMAKRINEIQRPTQDVESSVGETMKRKMSLAEFEALLEALTDKSGYRFEEVSRLWPPPNEKYKKWAVFDSGFVGRVTALCIGDELHIAVFRPDTLPEVDQRLVKTHLANKYGEEEVSKWMILSPGEGIGAHKLACRIEELLPPPTPTPTQDAGSGAGDVDLSKLLDVLNTGFSSGDLRELCFHLKYLGVDYDNLRGEGKKEKILALIEYCERREYIPELVKVGKQQRPDIPWSDVTTQPTASTCPTLPLTTSLLSSTPNTQLDSILIVTVTKVEAQAVLDVFSQAAGTRWTRQVIGKKTYYDLGTHGGVPVFMVQSEVGIATPGGALLTVHQAIQDLHPQAIIMCGIAFGLRPGKQQLGDILVAKQIQYYEPQKVDIQRGQMPRGDRATSAERLLDRFRSGDLDWQGAPRHFGLVLSGEKLVNDPTFQNRILETEPEAVGGEMEGAGLYAAARDAKVDWILVKAICDWADGKKNDDAHPLAAGNAAQFVLHVLRLGGWNEAEQLRSDVMK